MNQAGGYLSSGLTVVAYELETVAPGCGGMGAISGSHKSNFLLDPDALGLPDGGRIRDLQLPPWATAVPVEKGDAIIFTEALTHATLPWAGSNPRKTVFYKRVIPRPLVIIGLSDHEACGA